MPGRALTIGERPTCDACLEERSRVCDRCAAWEVLRVERQRFAEQVYPDLVPRGTAGGGR